MVALLNNRTSSGASTERPTEQAGQRAAPDRANKGGELQALRGATGSTVETRATRPQARARHDAGIEQPRRERHSATTREARQLRSQELRAQRQQRREERARVERVTTDKKTDQNDAELAQGRQQRVQQRSVADGMARQSLANAALAQGIDPESAGRETQPLRARGEITSVDRSSLKADQGTAELADRTQDRAANPAAKQAPAPETAQVVEFKVAGFTYGNRVAGQPGSTDFLNQFVPANYDSIATEEEEERKELLSKLNPQVLQLLEAQGFTPEQIHEAITGGAIADGALSKIQEILQALGAEAPAGLERIGCRALAVIGVRDVALGVTSPLKKYRPSDN